MQNIVVAYNASPEQKALFLEVLGSFATLTYLKGEKVMGIARRVSLKGGAWPFH